MHYLIHNATNQKYAKMRHWRKLIDVFYIFSINSWKNPGKVEQIKDTINILGLHVYLLMRVFTVKNTI